MKPDGDCRWFHGVPFPDYVIALTGSTVTHVSLDVGNLVLGTS